MRNSLLGTPMRPPRSRVTTLVVEPTLGFNASQPMTDLPLGQTPDAVNWLMRDGAIEPRSRLSNVATNANPLGTLVTGGMEAISSVGSLYPVISGTTRWAWYSAGSWSAMSYVSSAGYSAPPSGGTTTYYDMAQIYYPTTDEMLVVAGSESYQTLFCWSVGSTLFSSMSNAPRAKYVTTFDNYILTLNSRDTGSAESRYVQRVQWCGRGNPMVWNPATDATAGFEDLLAARGEGTRITDMDNRVIVFFESEIWVGVRAAGVTSFTWEPLDRTVGTRNSWTIAKTPVGLMFLGNDFMVYLLPKEGGGAQPVGKATQRYLRENMDKPDRAWALYDETTNAYRLFYPTRGGTSVPTREFVFNLLDASAAHQVYEPRSLSRGFPAFLQNATAGLTYDDLTTAGYTYNTIPYTYDQMAATSTRVNRAVFLGSSSGTMYHLSSTETRDDGTAVEARWRSSGLMPEAPESQKAVTSVRVDVDGTVASHVTIRVTRDQGQTFDPGQQVSIPVTSNQTQVVAWMQTPCRYPQLELTTEEVGVRVYRLWAQMRVGGQ